MWLWQPNGEELNEKEGRIFMTLEQLITEKIDFLKRQEANALKLGTRAGTKLAEMNHSNWVLLESLMTIQQSGLNTENLKIVKTLIDAPTKDWSWFQKKPVNIKAALLDEDCLIETLEGLMKASKGDWIIQGIKGELYACKPGIFKETYSELQSEADSRCDAHKSCDECGGELQWEECYDCDGVGAYHDCGEDTCCCADPDPNCECPTCSGDGGWQFCDLCRSRAVAELAKQQSEVKS